MKRLPIFHQLLEQPGAQALMQASALVRTDRDFLPALQALQRDYPEQIAHEAVSQALLRVKAEKKFSLAHSMFFTGQGLEQASGDMVAGYRARRLGAFELLIDLTAGIGGDALSFARMGPVVAVEQDMHTLEVLQANRLSLGLEASLFPVAADSLAPAWRLPAGTVVFMDPARRTSSGRVYSIEQYQPDFRHFLPQLDRAASMVVKVSPAVKWEEIAGMACEVEFISVAGELKEAALWFGEAYSTERRATILPQEWTLTGEAPGEERIADPGVYLYEPNPAVLRAGLVQQLACVLNGSRIEPTLGLLTSDRLVETDAARVYRILDVLPFGLKRLRRELRERGVGRIILKKRGSAVDTADFEKQLNLRGEGFCTVMLTRTRRGKVSMLLEEIDGKPDGDTTAR